MWNENKTDEMVSILTHLHQYVPKRSEESAVYVESTGDTEVVLIESLFPLLVGGDQLTSERIRGAQSVRKNSTTPTGRLQGIVPVSEDWHAKACMLLASMFLYVPPALYNSFHILCIGNLEKILWYKEHFY